MSDVELAELVATKTAERLDKNWTAHVENLKRQWQKDLARLRDDLTVKGLIQASNCGLDCPFRERLVVKVNDAKVLVADDYEPIRKVLTRILSEAGVTTFEAENGLDAAELLRKEPGIDVVVADISMPKNGYTLLEYVREHYPHIPVVVVSGYETEAERALKFGAFGFLQKPFTAAQVVLAIEAAVTTKRQERSGDPHAKST